ncbi:MULTISPECIES: LysR family transcriptional regulator [Paraburkholderia]|jgi:DNA-binding transcriptional LysR family regulator|uniref:DNA-binding transcriptional regulator, LysR family n=3 Tax=Paraburkholderia TaxID=1822464 RepID=A0A7Z7BCP3_9BURK|nr:MULTISPECIES: LysR family transcriptional regulator [Paraburkholderia]EUC19716.1 transcriptional regulator, LysR family [Burkholderia sp. BT03]SKC98940.1 DNA-binding transcriptional regulator, LysR family [Burkholderia sp. CF099]AUT64212.1 LysR family transcriptional regulator [Paraburkholderia terrae]AUT73754.1 LysR family transcriptional regulator [Paraburkholderia hospita]AXF03397.1 LysR family transcriptional regulator [Paraburkholderia hospita]
MLDSNPWYVRTRLKTRQLLLLVALDEEGNIHRAADALSMSQPAASKLLRELEEMLDAPLFERMPRGMRPTLYGEVMIRHARSVVGSLDQAREEVLALKSGQLGRVAVGTITSPAVSLLPAAIAQVKQHHPGLSVSVEIDSSNVLLESLAQDKLDLVIGRLSVEHDKLHLRYEPLAEEQALAVARSGHPLLAAQSLTLADVVDASWVVPPAQSVLRHRFELMFQRQSLAPPSNVVESAELLFVTSLLSQSDMLAVLAAEVAHYYAAHGLLSILPLDMPLRMDDFGIITRTGQLLSPASTQVVRALKQVAGELYGAIT